MARTRREPAKPLLDSVTEAVGAIADLVRSIRAAREQAPQRTSKSKRKGRPGRARVARVTVVRTSAPPVVVKVSSRPAADGRTTEKPAGGGLRARIERAWDTLTHGAPETDAECRVGEPPRA